MNISNYIKINNQISTAGQPTKKEFKQIAKEGFEVDRVKLFFETFR